MGSVYRGLLLMLLYLVLVFLAFRILDVILIWQHGIPSTHIVEPILLSVKHLKQLLEVRGVSDTGYVERKELESLVEASAPVTQGEIDELEEVVGDGSVESERARLSSSTTYSYFSGAAHFYEEVEDTKDSVWLVQVVTSTVPDQEPLLDDYTWRKVRSQVAPFAIRTGIFDCRLDRRLCSAKGWLSPILLLSLPRGTKPKDKVVMRTCRNKRPQEIIEWLRQELSIRVKKISSLQEVQRDWLHTNNTNGNATDSGVKVLLITELLHPPLFFTALSIKFTGRITFGVFTPKIEELDKVGHLPSYYVITPEKTTLYGERRMEYFNLRSMNDFLKVIQPEINDVFLCSLLLINMFAILRALQVPMETWWRILAVSLWTLIVCNLFLFTTWLILLGSLRWPNGTKEALLKILRSFALSPFGSLVRSDWVRLMRNPGILLGTLIGFGILARKRLNPNQSGEQVSSNQRRWWEIDCLFRSPPTSLTQPITMPEMELEEGLEMLLERLAVPNLWLTSPSDLQVAPSDYIKDLRVWKYQTGKKGKESPETLQRIMDCSDDSFLSLFQSSSTVRRTDSDEEFTTPKTTECAICLERYRSGALICALPCSHNFHHKCILSWLERDNHHCPLCRWPAYENKSVKGTQ